MIYTPNNWYWIVGGDEANVWSSASYSSIPITDATYTAWLAAGGQPTPIATKAELQAVFADAYPAGMLESYCIYQRWVKEQGGIALTSGMPIATDDRAQAKITGVFVAAKELPTMTTPWSAADNTVHVLDADQIIAMNNELLTHINNCFSISADVLAQIEAGTITTREQIDAAFDAPITQARKDWLKPQG